MQTWRPQRQETKFARCHGLGEIQSMQIYGVLPTVRVFTGIQLD